MDLYALFLLANTHKGVKRNMYRLLVLRIMESGMVTIKTDSIAMENYIFQVWKKQGIPNDLYGGNM